MKSDYSILKKQFIGVIQQKKFLIQLTVILRLVELLCNILSKDFHMTSCWTGKHLTIAPLQGIQVLNLYREIEQIDKIFTRDTKF